jgi:hypothetical protein
VSFTTNKQEYEMVTDNPYFEAGKMAFAIVGGGALAYTVVRAGYKLVKRGAKAVVNESKPTPEADESDNSES